MNSQALNDTTAIRDNDRLRKAAEMRYPLYYQFLKDWETIGYKTITCHDIAAELGLKASQVLDDLESIGIIHSPRIGYILCNVVYELEVFFGWNKLNDGIIVGAGSIGSALLGYGKFELCGLKIVAAFDLDHSKVGTLIHGKEVHSLEEMTDFVQQKHISIGAITVPAAEAQTVTDALVQSGIRAIWNFSPVHLEVPEHIIVQNQDLYSSLAALSKKLNAAVPE